MLIERYGMTYYLAGNMYDERTPPFLRDEEPWVGLDATNQPDAYSELTDSDFGWRVYDAQLPYILDMAA